jgi:uncharacterized membrane protein
MIVAALLSALHILAFGIGLGSVFARGRALAGRLDEAGWKRLLTADTLWGVAALIWITTGVARLFYGGKHPDFYWRNGLLWVKLGLFATVFVLELTPMRTFMRARTAQRRGLPMPQFPVERVRRINTIELVLVVTIVFIAPFMARGAWLY